MQDETPRSKLARRVDKQQNAEAIALAERKAHAARSTEILKQRFGCPDDEK